MGFGLLSFAGDRISCHQATAQLLCDTTGNGCGWAMSFAARPALRRYRPSDFQVI
jgi:hypothetical protein